MINFEKLMIFDPITESYESRIRGFIKSRTVDDKTVEILVQCKLLAPKRLEMMSVLRKFGSCSYVGKQTENGGKIDVYKLTLKPNSDAKSIVSQISNELIKRKKESYEEGWRIGDQMFQDMNDQAMRSHQEFMDFMT